MTSRTHSPSSQAVPPSARPPQPEPAVPGRAQLTSEDRTESALRDALLDPEPLNRTRLDTITRLLGLACLRAADADLSDGANACQEGSMTEDTFTKLDLGGTEAPNPEALEPKAPLASGPSGILALAQCPANEVQGHATQSTAMILGKVAQGEER